MCGERAQVAPTADGVRLTCPHCGHSATDPHRHSLELADYEAGRPAFGAPLWLSAECCGAHQLWAVNTQHLDYLADYISETQRNRAFPSPPGNRQLGYKLPAWMKAAKHRDEVLRTLTRLRQTL